MAAPTFPTLAAQKYKMVRGAAWLHIATYQAAGANPPAGEVVFLGACEGPIVVEGGPQWTAIDGGEEFPGVIDHVMESDSYVIKAKLREVDADLLGTILGGGATFASNEISAVGNVARETGAPPANK